MGDGFTAADASRTIEIAVTLSSIYLSSVERPLPIERSTKSFGGNFNERHFIFSPDWHDLVVTGAVTIEVSREP